MSRPLHCHGHGSWDSLQRDQIPHDVSRTAARPTNQEIFKWTLTSDAIATCFVRDVLSLRDEGTKDVDFFWLGRIPCRMVRILGMVVGVQIYETRIIYTVDDGTAVIECPHRQVQPPASPSKRPASSKYDSSDTTSSPEPPKPIASVGSTICLTGKVINKYNSKQIQVDQIELCKSSNDQPTHWKNVVLLHRSLYSGSDPFVIPSAVRDIPPPVALPPQERVTHKPAQISEAIEVTEDRPRTPSIRCSTPSTLTASSPAKSITAPQSPPRLRHPSRLHSRDLTSNTFRIYLKHYMDNAPSDDWSPPIAECDFLSSTRKLCRVNFDDPTTPTKRPRQSYLSENDNTPRPSCRPASPLESSETPDTVQGFTLSYLRRVPELSEMARRVVKAEKQRRALEEQKRANTQTKDEMQKSAVENRPREPIAPKMKRLFQWAIRQLYQDGSIILWNGPVRHHSHARCNSIANSSTTKLWKLKSSNDDTISSIASSVAKSRRRHDVSTREEEGELSDPVADEEAYIPLTATLLAVEVEKAIVTLMARPVFSTLHRRLKPGGGPRPGPTRDEILGFLKRTDERWARVGEWTVDEALEVLRSEERAWHIGGGRWELCL